MNAMKWIWTLSCVILLAQNLSAQRSKAIEEMDRSRSGGLQKTSGILDRAGGLHNKSNIGEFFENRGKLYARFRSQGPSGEFPIGSNREYIYRINPFVGVKGNVIQGRYTTNEEWEAAAGYNNRDSAQIAFSDKPYTWPATGWPVKDSDGKEVFVSDQDSYCVYNDSGNTKQLLQIQVNQTGYAFGLKLVKDMIFFKYEIINKSDTTYNDLYFGMYVDLDIGNASGGVPEYSDDRLGIDRALNLLYSYDSDHFSPEWPGAPPGYFGYALLQTPKVNGAQVGWTDMHYNVYDDDLDRDSIQYGILSSAQSLYNSSVGSRYFHLGSNAPNLHFDDTATVPQTGLDLVAMMGSGPYSLDPGDTLTFMTVMVAGNDLQDIKTNTQRAYDLYSAGFASPRPPEPAPQISVVPGNGKVFISWDNRAESSRDRLTGRFDFEGYKLYKSNDLGQHWDQIDRNAQPNVGPDPVPLATFDKIDGSGNDTGLQYSYVDSSVTNGLEYWYSITAYDTGDSLVESLENARGNNAEAPNLGIAIPRSAAVGRTPVGASPVTQTGSGEANVRFAVRPNDTPETADRTFEISFEPIINVQRGNLRTITQVTIDSLNSNTSHQFGLSFLSPTSFQIRDITSDIVLIANGTYMSGSSIAFAGLNLTLTDTSAFPEQQPEQGDSLVIQPGIRIVSSNIDVLPLRPLLYGTQLSTSNGVVLTITPINPIQGITQVSGSYPVTVKATVANAAAVIDQTYRLRFLSTFTDTSGTQRVNVELRNAADSLISEKDSLESGGTLAGQGFTLSISFEASTPPSAGTIVEIHTVRQKMITYADKFSFTTSGATVDPNAVAAALDRVKVVPNPYLVSSLYEREFGTLRREPIRQLNFNNLPPQCTIYIFTLAGDKVQTIEHNSTDGTETWNMKGAGGREIAPGVYIYLVKTDNAEKIGRFAVIK